MSLGRAAVHALPNKLDQAARYGFEGIELYFEDLEYFAYDLFNTSKPSGEQLLEAARQIRRLCKDRNLTIINLQPFMHYEGLRDRAQHAKRIEEMKLWIQLAHALGTTIIQVPSSFLPAEQLIADDNLDTIVSDLREIADLGLPQHSQQPTISFAYESLAWGTHIDTWEQCWAVVQRVDRPNFGICLDTFNMAARVYADPAAASGRTANAEADIAASVARLCGAVDASKVFFVQLVDGERLAEPLVEGHPFYDPLQPARLSWSRNCRLFYGEERLGGYLPVRAIAEAFLNGIGYEGWWSMELFNRCMWDKDPTMPEQLARRGIASWQKLKEDLHMVDAKVINGVLKPAGMPISCREMKVDSVLLRESVPWV